MLKKYKIYLFISFVVAGSFILSGYTFSTPNKDSGAFTMPYKKAGLTKRQAAAHLLSRFTFGPTPASIDEAVNMGLEKWFLQQLDGKLQDAELNYRLAGLDAVNFDNTEVLKEFPRGGTIKKEAIDSGLINKDSAGNGDKAQYKEIIAQFMKRRGYRPQQELIRQFVSQKILRAAYSNNQLQQVLTDFWFNHFNVSATKNDCLPFIPAFERDVIRPNVTGKFADLLMATAKSPAMLFYLDNFSSAGENDDFKAQQEKRQKRLEKNAALMMEEDSASTKTKLMQKLAANKKNAGLNENYAREIMELHTLGVDGGYTQQDVTQAARVLTGWTVFPMAKGPNGYLQKVIEKVGEENLAAKGYVHDKDFLFAINRHDNREKTVLGKTFAAGGGFDEGVALINMLAHHPATAHFICQKLAVKFVSDNPPAVLVNKMTATFLAKDGDIKEVLKTMVSSPEFWNKDAVAQKTKSPFELAISAVRSLDADVSMPMLLYEWINKMGQKLYYYQAPTGFPDKGQYWINTGALLNRMNFGLALASQKIPGIQFNLAAINNNHEPESAAAALEKYSLLILPERNTAATVKRLTPLINDPSIQQKIDVAAGKNAAVSEKNITMESDAAMEPEADGHKQSKQINEARLARKAFKKGKGKEIVIPAAAGNNSMLAQVVGIILGSPEFQRR